MCSGQKLNHYVIILNRTLFTVPISLYKQNADQQKKNNKRASFPTTSLFSHLIKCPEYTSKLKHSRTTNFMHAKTKKTNCMQRPKIEEKNRKGCPYIYLLVNSKSWSASFKQTELYIEDWIGLKTLDDAGRVKYVKVPGNHLGISKPDMKKYIVPYLEDDTSKKDSIKTEVGLSASSVNKREMQNLMRPKDVISAEIIIEGSSSYGLPASIKSFFEELFGITEDEQTLVLWFLFIRFIKLCKPIKSL